MTELLNKLNDKDKIIWLEAKVKRLELELEEFKKKEYEPYKQLETYIQDAKLVVTHRPMQFDELDIRLWIPARTFTMRHMSEKKFFKDMVFDKLVAAFEKHLVKLIYENIYDPCS